MVDAEFEVRLSPKDYALYEEYLSHTPQRHYNPKTNSIEMVTSPKPGLPSIEAAAVYEMTSKAVEAMHVAGLMAGLSLSQTVQISKR